MKIKRKEYSVCSNCGEAFKTADPGQAKCPHCEQPIDQNAVMANEKLANIKTQQNMDKVIQHLGSIRY